MRLVRPSPSPRRATIWNLVRRQASLVSEAAELGHRPVVKRPYSLAWTGFLAKLLAQGERNAVDYGRVFHGRASRLRVERSSNGGAGRRVPHRSEPGQAGFLSGRLHWLSDGALQQNDVQHFVDVPDRRQLDGFQPVSRPTARSDRYGLKRHNDDGCQGN
jgi:hypothetical protein